MTRPLLLIFDKNNMLQDIPPDALDANFETQVNGGSSTGTLQFPRRFWNIGAIAEGYRVQFFMPDNLTVPWYDGRITEEDTAVTVANGKISVGVEGYATALDDADVTFTLSPGVQPNGVDNGQMDYGAMLSWMLGKYLPSGFTASVPASAGVNVMGIQANHQGLGQTLDQVTRSILDSSSAHWEWYCDGAGIASTSPNKIVTVQPVSVNAASPISCDQLVDLYEYDLRVDYKSIKNMLVLYGGKDPTTGETAWGSFTSSSSISSYGLRQFSQTVSQLTSNAQVQQYATAQLALLSQPTYTGSFKVLRPTSAWRGGKWVQVFEPYSNGLRTMRLSKVTIEVKGGARITMTCEPNSPIPSIDKAIFDSANRTSSTISGVAARPQTTSLSGVSTLVSGGNIVSFA